MSTNAESDLAELRARMKAQNRYAGERGEKWVKHYDEKFKRLPKGTIVIINCRTGEYVLAPNRLKAADEYEQRFGKGKDTGYMIEIGELPLWGRILADITGYVDVRNRPIVSLPIPGADEYLVVVIDTGFNGELLIDDADIRRLNCEVADYSEPVELANRERHLLNRGRGQIVWFGRLRHVNVFIANMGQSRAAMVDAPVALMGTALLSPHKLIVDFATRRVVISENTD